MLKIVNKTNKLKEIILRINSKWIWVNLKYKHPIVINKPFFNSHKILIMEEHQIIKIFSKLTQFRQKFTHNFYINKDKLNCNKKQIILINN